MRVNSKETILNNMLSNFKGTCVEGDITYTIFSAVASALEKEYLVRHEQDKAFLLSDAKGNVLDEQISWFGITRLEGTVSKGVAVINGNTDGKVGQEQVLFDTNGNLFVIGQIRTDISETVVAQLSPPIYVDIFSAEVGLDKNLVTGTLLNTNEFNYDSIVTYSDILGGTNRESDSDFLSRFLYIQKNRGNAGNEKHYIEWAITVEGVGFAKVLPLVRGAGTVDILITDSKGQPCTREVIQACQEYINTQKPVGADALVKTAEIEVLNVEGTYELYQPEQEDATKQALDDNISEMIAQLINLGVKEVHMSKIAGMVEAYPNVKRAKVTNHDTQTISLDPNKVYDVKINLTQEPIL